MTALPVPGSTDAWSKDALMSKAQRYFEQMLEYEHDDWRFGFWSSLALELLARAALANVSPALLADAAGNWNNLYYALGYAPTAKKFTPKSIDTNEVLRRLNEMNPEFDADSFAFCVVHAARRNEELHTGSNAFGEIKNSTWLPSFYKACSVLAKSLGESLELFVGEAESEFAETLMKAASDEAAKSIKKQISAHETIWSAKTDGERDKAALQATAWATRERGHRVSCPACKCDSLVTGQAISSPKQTLKDDMIVETQQHLPSKFVCRACGLKVSGFSLLNAAGVGDTYTSTTSYDPAEYYAPADPDDYIDDNNE